MKRKFMTNAMAIVMAVVTCGSISAKGIEVEKLKERVDPIVERVEKESDWLCSRLQMFWCSKARDVFVNGETFSHVGEERAPVPTVKYNGTRGMECNYRYPDRIEDVVPYDDDENGSVTMINKATGVMERVELAKAGCNPNAMNRRVIGYAKDAAVIYRETRNERYLPLIRSVVDTYLRGILYRNTPYDLNRGHQQTLVGLATFEVIHEDAITDISTILECLGGTREERARVLGEENLVAYENALRHWMENIIAGGVPHNNWNLFQAEFLLNAALVLNNDSAYADGRGRQHYLDYIVNRNSIRQWSMRKLIEYGFDMETGVWCESPGYSLGVVNTIIDFANKLDKRAGIDIIKTMPVLKTAIFVQAQYLFPNRMYCGFGDSHPEALPTKGVDALMDYAERHNEVALMDSLRDFRKSVAALTSPEGDYGVDKYVTSGFASKKNSWLVRRSGMNAKHDLMYVLNGSMGNHQHANGISMELYGKGWVMGPDAGIGRNLYSGLDYQEYYSQFPAHNTVCVDGMSSYPVMMSQHGFIEDKGIGGEECASQVRFIEPETQSDQLRTNALVKTSEHGGFYVDIFRSKRRDGKDRFHDYFYHNLGQEMEVGYENDGVGGSLTMIPTEELAFAGGHLYAYSYIYNKEKAKIDRDVVVTFTMTPQQHIDGSKPAEKVWMKMWMNGGKGRTAFKALSPANIEYERMPHEPYDIDRQPVLTFVARQEGEAWDNPFVAIYEPSSSDEPSEINKVEFFKPDSKVQGSAVGIKVTVKDGTVYYIFSAPEKAKMEYEGIKVNDIFKIIKR